MYIYVYFIREQLGIRVDEIRLWFPRADHIETFPYDAVKEAESMKWFGDAIRELFVETEFPPNNLEVLKNGNKKLRYFYEQICGVRANCKYSGGLEYVKPSDETEQG